MSRRLFKLLLVFCFGFHFNRCFVNQHHGNVVANRIEPVAFNTLQPAPIRFQFHGGFARGTGENFQQILTNCHGLKLTFRFRSCSLQAPRNEAWGAQSLTQATGPEQRDAGCAFALRFFADAEFCKVGRGPLHNERIGKNG